MQLFSGGEIEQGQGHRYDRRPERIITAERGPSIRSDRCVRGRACFERTQELPQHSKTSAERPSKQRLLLAPWGTWNAAPVRYSSTGNGPQGSVCIIKELMMYTTRMVQQPNYWDSPGIEFARSTSITASSGEEGGGGYLSSLCDGNQLNGCQVDVVGNDDLPDAAACGRSCRPLQCEGGSARGRIAAGRHAAEDVFVKSREGKKSQTSCGQVNEAPPAAVDGPGTL